MPQTKWFRCVLMAALGFASMPAVSQDSLEDLERRLDSAKTAEAKKKAEAQRKVDAGQRAEAARRAEEARQGTLIVRADGDCVLSVNGEAKGQLVAEQTKTLSVKGGQSLIECVGEGDRRVETTERIPAGEQVVVKLSLPPPPRFAAVSDGVRDNQENVIWAARDNGADVSWSQAGQYCRTLGPNWTLPTVAQLQSLYDSSGQYARSWTTPYSGSVYNIKVATPLIQWSSCCFWSSESKGSSEAWIVVLGNGGRGSFDVSFGDSKRALCVRRS